MNKERKNTNRRQFLKTAGKALAGTLLASSSLALINQASAYAQSSDDFDKYDFLMPRVKFDCDSRVRAHWSVYPGADRNLLTEFSRVVRCKVKLPENCNNILPTHGSQQHFNAVFDLTDLERMRKYPFLFMTAEGEYTLSEMKKENLKKYLHQGGFLLMDDCIFSNGGDFFYQSSFKQLEQIFGPGSVKSIPSEHEVFHNVYDFADKGMPYIKGQHHGAKGIFIGDRLTVFLSATDLHCGWAGCWGKSSLRYQNSIRMGINIIMYAISH